MNVDVVVVAYRSAAHLRGCVEPLTEQPEIRVYVVDNACPERSTDTVAGLDLEIVRMGRNAGFGSGCNAGARLGSGEAILFLNPDARMAPDDVRRLAASFHADPSCGALGPHIFETNGEDQPSMRRAPTLRSAFGEALFIHHLLPRASWPTEIVHDGYGVPTDTEWLSGAVLCVRRSAFESVGGFDEGFFMYCEDVDLCMRLWEHGFAVRYEPSATAVHEGGASGPRPLQAGLKVLARLRYAKLHERGLRYRGFYLAYLLHELCRIPLAAVRSPAHLRGRLRAVGAALTFTVKGERKVRTTVG